jgi:hypothetical protein
VSRFPRRSTRNVAGPRQFHRCLLAPSGQKRTFLGPRSSLSFRLRCVIRLTRVLAARISCRADVSEITAGRVDCDVHGQIHWRHSPRTGPGGGGDPRCIEAMCRLEMYGRARRRGGAGIGRVAWKQMRGVLRLGRPARRPVPRRLTGQPAQGNIAAALRVHRRYCGEVRLRRARCTKTFSVVQMGVPVLSAASSSSD